MKLTPQEKTELKFVLTSFAEIVFALTIVLVATFLISKI